MDYPNMLYRCPGAHQCLRGTFDYTGVNSDSQAAILLAAGWSETLPEAMAKKYGTPIEVAPSIIQQADLDRFKDELEVLGDDEPPTRAELEKQAGELGIKFNHKMTDKDLVKKIDAALED